MKYMKKYIHKYWKGFCLAIFCLAVEAMCDLMQPTIMSKIVDIGVANKDMDYIVKHGFIMLTITGLGALGASGRNILSGNVSQKFSRDLRKDLFNGKGRILTSSISGRWIALIILGSIPKIIIP